MKADAVTIYGASSPKINPAYLEAADRVGRLLAHAGVPLVCGGGRTGIMAAAIDGAITAGGTAIGVLPEFMVERQWQHPGLTRMEVTPDMHARKELMAGMARAVIAMPGGVGTLEELLEIITWRQLGLYQGNVVILNVDGYFDPLLDMLDRSIQQHFMNPDHASLWLVADTPERAVSLALDTPVEHRPFTQKIV
ncbi:MAG: TIGR00730 family Rossman fold protein [Bacteroides sp.]|nr:TIGR00730 family Rossman fold protein [Bacteroides sp.]